ncbi:NAD(+)/NADH kinase [Pseudorhodoferax sp.]|uniref:NAD(+)/NADH kinase n=1 Tax=Pseudorhodoferax sp. TaxID=1993553 RepID=UPI002DD64A08|nr:NAD(+)/NADH kinase [Pseudorhodoferax sp.]
MSHPPVVGLIANPVSARDIRRIVANAGNLQLPDRVNIVLRLLAALAATGVGRVRMMPDRAGLAAMLQRHLARERRQGHVLAEVELLDMVPGATVEDSCRAARLLRAQGATAIVVLGGDGTHRAVVRELVAGAGDWRQTVPVCGLSTGTNNAFPELRESTTAGLAVGLYASGRLGAEVALVPNKLLDVRIDGAAGTRHDIALVDAVIADARLIGARALWKPEGLHSVYLAFAEPQAIGLSSIGGLLQPVARTAPGGLAVQLAPTPQGRQCVVHAPIAPGMVCPVGIARVESMPAGQPFDVGLPAGVVALDGERELAFAPGERVQVRLRENAFATLDVGRCLHEAAARGLLWAAA